MGLDQGEGSSMSKAPSMPISSILTDARALKASLISDGWVSPDTYSREFSAVKRVPAVYLFMLHDAETFINAAVAYVGMTQDLKQRWSGHEVLAQIDHPDYWTMRWFKPTTPENLRDTESGYILKFNPPWNLIGKRLGVDLNG